VFVATIRMQMGGQHAGLGIGAQYHRACAITEQHAGAAISPVDHAGQCFRANHQRGTHGAGLDKLVGNTQRIDKTRARGVDVECGTAVGTQTVLQQAGCGRKDDIGRGGTEHDQVDLAGFHPGRIQGVGCGVKGKITGRLTGSRNMALADTSAITYPLVTGLDHHLKVGIGHHLFGQVTTGTDDAGINPTRVALRVADIRHALTPKRRQHAARITRTGVMACAAATPNGH